MNKRAKALFCALLLLIIFLCCSTISFASGEIDTREPSDYKDQMVSFSEIVPEPETEETVSDLVIYIPSLTLTTTENAYESAVKDAQVLMSRLAEEKKVEESIRAATTKNYDLSINLNCLCSVKGDVAIQIRNTDTETVYPITLSPQDSYYHYREYPAGNYELTDSSINGDSYTVETLTFSLGKYEHISLSVFVYDDEAEYKQAKESQLAEVSEYYAHVVTTNITTNQDIESSTSVADEEAEKISTFAFMLCVFAGLFCVTSLTFIYAKRKSLKDGDISLTDNQSI